jgi:ElaB/YqjD/DUF883 family membrane-anchored ribosome-binding protein
MNRTTQDQSSEINQSFSDKLHDATHAGRERIEDRDDEFIDRAMQEAGRAYDRAGKEMSEQYERVMDYGRENPEKMTLIAFGVGVGVGLLIAAGVGASRGRRGRRGPIAEPLMNALSNLAYEFIR